MAPAAACPYLQRLGVSAVQVMPPFEFAGDISWGYNPAHLFAIESGYGGPDAFKRFIRAAHEHGIAVIVDVVYNHFGPSDLDLWRFDGWAEGDGGGIYFYNDERAVTPWGATAPRLRPRRGPDVPARQRAELARGVPLRRPAVRFDDLRPDHRRRPGDPAAALPDGWLVPGVAQRRHPRPPALEDHDRRGPPGRPLGRRRDRRRRPRVRGPVGRRVHPTGSGPPWSTVERRRPRHRRASSTASSARAVAHP